MFASSSGVKCWRSAGEASSFRLLATMASGIPEGERASDVGSWSLSRCAAMDVGDSLERCEQQLKARPLGVAAPREDGRKKPPPQSIGSALLRHERVPPAPADPPTVAPGC